jgi:endonuclease YncB( thermonuclease family)
MIGRFYESFINKILEAESLARKEHLSIWSEKN